MFSWQHDGDNLNFVGNMRCKVEFIALSCGSSAVDKYGDDNNIASPGSIVKVVVTTPSFVATMNNGEAASGATGVGVGGIVERKKSGRK